MNKEMWGGGCVMGNSGGKFRAWRERTTRKRLAIWQLK